ncbi:MAG TPA: ribonuclease J [Solirubrobacteraceae bacterium]|nr:ribonuclease J [Solirubrobacteraceae bacterium]
MAPTLRVLPLGGLGEIGKNMTVVEYDGRILVVDAGVRFPTAEMHGIDLVLPDFSYITDRADRVDGIVLTHGHEDHVGALPWLLRELGRKAPPIHARQLTAAFAQSKLDEHRIKTKVQRIEPGRKTQVGPFGIEFIHVTHSIPDAAAVLVSTPLGRVLFTGDYRFDQTPVDGKPVDISRLARLGDEGLLLLCGDSTNADRTGFAPSESDVGPVLHDVFARCEGRIVVTSFASNIHRVQQVVDAAVRLDRRVALLGRSMVRNVTIGRELGHIDAPDRVLVDAKRLNSVPDEELVVMTTGSQGEPLAALRRMAYREHRQIKLHAGDTVVFSATPIPGNERAINDTIDRLFQIGCDVVTARDAAIHTSGHGHREELKLMLNITRPRYLMPMHGDHKRIRLHAELGASVGIPEESIFRADNGIPLEITKNGARLGDRERAGMVFVDGIELGDPTEVALRDRRAISEDGVLFVVATVSQDEGDTLAEHEIVLRGIPMTGSEAEFVAALRKAIETSLDRAADDEIHEVELVQQTLHDDLAAFVYDKLGRRPMIIPVVVEV